jgi:hypothetical protein
MLSKPIKYLFCKNSGKFIFCNRFLVNYVTNCNYLLKSANKNLPSNLKTRLLSSEKNGLPQSSPTNPKSNNNQETPIRKLLR